MQIFLWLILVGSILGLVGFLLSKLSGLDHQASHRLSGADQETAGTYVKRKFQILVRQLWHFVLEAKDLKPATKITSRVGLVTDQVKKVFRIRIRRHSHEPRWLPEATQAVRADQTAEEWYLEAIKKDPHDPEAYEHLGRLYLDNQKFAEAGEVFAYLAKLDPGKDSYFSNLALAYYGLGQYPQSIRAFEQALKLNDKVPARWINLSLALGAVGELARAIKAVTNALALDRTNRNYLMLLADFYLKAGNPVRSEQVLCQILELEPTHRSAREKLMKLRLK